MAIEQTVRLDADAKSYRRYEQAHEYSHDPGLVALPVASRAAAHKVIRLHGGIGRRKVKWVAERTGVPPYIPAAADTTGDTLLSSTVVPRLPVPNVSTESFDWLVSGEYEYVQTTPRVAGENAFPTGSHPFVVQPQQNYAAEYVGAYVGAVENDAAVTNKTDGLMAYAVAKVPVRDSYTVHWPFTVLPANASSTHIIGG